MPQRDLFQRDKVEPLLYHGKFICLAFFIFTHSYPIIDNFAMTATSTTVFCPKVTVEERFDLTVF